MWPLNFLFWILHGALFISGQTARRKLQVCVMLCRASGLDTWKCCGLSYFCFRLSSARLKVSTNFLSVSVFLWAKIVPILCLHSRDEFRSRKKFYSKEWSRISIVQVNSAICHSICKKERYLFRYHPACQSFRLQVDSPTLRSLYQHDLCRLAHIKVVSPTLKSKIFCEDRWTFLPTGSRGVVFDRISN